MVQWRSIAAVTSPVVDRPVLEVVVRLLGRLVAAGKISDNQGMNIDKFLSRLPVVIGILVFALILAEGVATYRVTHKSSNQLSETDRKDLKEQLEKIVREDLVSTKSATKINSVEISDPEMSDADHIVVSYAFSYDDGAQDQGVTHEMKAVAHLEKISGGWQIANVTSNDESLKFASPLLIQSQAMKSGTSEASAGDEFNGIKCGDDIAKIMVGKQTNDANLVATEKRHFELKLKGLGGDGDVNDPYALTFWQICGNDYVFLLGRSPENKPLVIKDILAFPTLAQGEHRFGPSSCKVNKQEIPEVLAILKGDPAQQESLPAAHAWTVDSKGMKFTSVPSENLTCPTTGIVVAEEK